VVKWFSTAVVPSIHQWAGMRGFLRGDGQFFLGESWFLLNNSDSFGVSYSAEIPKFAQKMDWLAQLFFSSEFLSKFWTLRTGLRRCLHLTHKAFSCMENNRNRKNSQKGMWHNGMRILTWLAYGYTLTPTISASTEMTSENSLGQGNNEMVSANEALRTLVLLCTSHHH
jgi:hypothetical protein